LIARSVSLTTTKKQCVEISNIEQETATISIQQSEITPLLELPVSSVFFLVSYTNNISIIIV